MPTAKSGVKVPKT